MAKSMPPAGRPPKTPGAQPAPKTPGATAGQGTMRQRAMGAKNGKQSPGAPKPEPQGGPGS